MRMTTPMRVAAAAASFALLVTACGGGGDEGDKDAGGGTGSADPDNPSGGTFSINLTEPSFLAPAQNCYESECNKVLSAINDPLVGIDAETGELQFEGTLAESVESNEDKTVWTLKLRDGLTFHNDEPVNADALMGAWNYSANPKNEMSTAGFMTHIEGAGEGETMTGLKKVDDLTVELTLKAPFQAFGQMMSYLPAWAPIAPACLEDIEACNEAPIGTGPYMMDGKWNHDQGITVTRWEGYQGDRGGQADSIEFTMFADSVAAFRGWQGGTLDVLDTLEPTIYAEATGAAGESQLETETSSLTYMGFPTKTAPFDSKEYRQSFSMAFDRQAVIDAVLNGQAKPSTDIPTPNIPGARDDACKYCEFNPEEAKKLFAEAGGKEGDTVELIFNAGSGHEGWVEAIGNELKNNLGINFTMKGMEWAQYLELLDAGGAKGPFRLGWSKDYPSPENFLRPIVGTGGDVNRSEYSNKELDDLVTEGDAAATPEEAQEIYAQASDLALEDLPLLPLWSGIKTIIWGENVENIVWDPVEEQVSLGQVIVK
ncbi:MAG: ABC transporter substrate-binding protein [Propionibacteriales bacterium]|nr:ABC transporter substrate-binding protein [Propionibacteriales bacterium]